MNGRIDGWRGAALALALVAGSVAAQQAALVTTDEVVRQGFTQTLPIIGRLVAAQAGVAAARVGGTVTAVSVRVGERVVRGQVLARIDAAPLRLRLALTQAQHAEASARLATAVAQLTLAQQAAQRLSGLTNSATVSRADFDDSQQRHSIALARVSEATAAQDSGAAAVALARLDLQYADTVAPFDGTVTERLTEVGGYVQRGVGMLRLVSDRRLEVEADVPYDRLGGIRVGSEVEVRLDNGTSHRAVTRAVIPEENPRTRTRRVRFSAVLGADAGPLAAQQSVGVMIPAGARRDIVSVHKDAIVQRGRGAIVFVVVDGAAAMRSVRTGAQSGERLEVLDGLAPGDQAVVRGNERLVPGQPVAVAPL